MDRTEFGLPFATAALGVRCSHGDRPSEFTSVHLLEKMLKPCQIVPDSAISGACFRQATAFRMSFWNNQIGPENGIFGDQKASLDGSPESPMTDFYRCSPYFRVGKGSQSSAGFKIASVVQNDANHRSAKHCTWSFRR